MTDEKRVILLAEDEEDLREMYSLGMSNEGCEVLKAANGKEALEWLEKKYAEIKAIFLDIIMPEMDGFEALKIIKKDARFEKIPVFIFSNLDNEEDKQQAIALGAEEYFVKAQHTPSELAQKIDLLLSKK
ncbi:MAG TPA: response regulator [Candidatus Moranbacteria bacterium]|nr:response regulator [Candidatus Moranbacteria bacterium]HRY28126.1 response regulator [Candidatus Moranbacteria bacterium]